jgi:uncharacterized coiled-coil protein SlyX
MTLTEQIIEAGATYGPGLAALALAVRQWLTSRSRLDNALASQTEIAQARERKLERRIEALEGVVWERERAIADLTDAVLDCERGRAVMEERLERSEARSLRIAELLRTAGIDVDDDSGAAATRLGQVIALASAQVADRARIARIRDVSAVTREEER